MNHLAHFKVAHPETGLIVGGFLGDFVKGRLQGQFPAPVERGIRLHRAVDAFSDQHEIVRASARRFDDRFRRYAPPMIDVIFDHFLANRWQDWDSTPLPTFAREIFDALDRERTTLTPDACAVADRMSQARSLENYTDEAFVARALMHMGKRLRRSNPLDEGFDEFQRLKGELEADFELFFPDLLAFCEHWCDTH